MQTQATNISRGLTLPLKDLLSIYVPSARYVEGFEIRNEVGYALLYAQEACYCRAPGLQHLTAVQLQICLNQMLYCYFALAGTLDTFEDYVKLSAVDLAQWQAAKTYLIEQQFRFHRSIDVSKSFCATLKLERFRKTSKICVAKVAFDFADGACLGEAKAAVVP